MMLTFTFSILQHKQGKLQLLLKSALLWCAVGFRISRTERLVCFSQGKVFLHFIWIIHSVFVWQIKKGSTSPHSYAYSIFLTWIKKFIICLLLLMLVIKLNKYMNEWSEWMGGSDNQYSLVYIEKPSQAQNW